MNTSKYGIPVVGALAFSMTGCQDLLSSGADGDWEAIEFNGSELENPYSEGYGYNSYLSLNMTLSSGEFADATWNETYTGDEAPADRSLTFSGDYVTTDSGAYDILITSSGSPAQLNLICTLSGDDMDCSDVTYKSTADGESQASGAAYFVRSGTKTE